MHKLLASRVIGFLASLILTAAAFLIVVRPEFFHLRPRMDILVILILAVLQFLVQSICFLNIWGEKGPRWTLLIFVSTISMVLIIIVFSIWIMNHLNYNMMHTPMSTLLYSIFEKG
jgi:cytochrome o ubiquinol oxidase subunit IV